VVAGRSSNIRPDSSQGNCYTLAKSASQDLERGGRGKSHKSCMLTCLPRKGGTIDWQRGGTGEGSKDKAPGRKDKSGGAWIFFRREEGENGIKRDQQQGNKGKLEGLVGTKKTR